MCFPSRQPRCPALGTQSAQELPAGTSPQGNTSCAEEELAVPAAASPARRPLPGDVPLLTMD